MSNDSPMQIRSLSSVAGDNNYLLPGFGFGLVFAPAVALFLLPRIVTRSRYRRLLCRKYISRGSEVL